MQNQMRNWIGLTRRLQDASGKVEAVRAPSRKIDQSDSTLRKGCRDAPQVLMVRSAERMEIVEVWVESTQAEHGGRRAISGSEIVTPTD